MDFAGISEIRIELATQFLKAGYGGYTLTALEGHKDQLQKLLDELEKCLMDSPPDLYTADEVTAALDLEAAMEVIANKTLVRQKSMYEKAHRALARLEKVQIDESKYLKNLSERRVWVAALKELILKIGDNALEAP